MLTDMGSSLSTYSAVELSGWVHCCEEVSESPSAIEVTSKSISVLGVAARSSTVGGIIELVAKGAMLMTSINDTRSKGHRLRI